MSKESFDGGPKVAEMPAVSQVTHKMLKKLDEQSGRGNKKVSEERVCHRCRKSVLKEKMKQYISKSGVIYYNCQKCLSTKRSYRKP